MPSVKLRGVSGNKLQRDNGTAGDDNEKIILVNKKIVRAMKDILKIVIL